MGKISAEMNPAKPDVTEQIKEDIRRTEASITDTLHSIEHRFSPAHIKSELKGKMRRYALVGLVKTTDAVREKKVQAVLGAGAVLYAMRKLSTRGRKSSPAAKGSAVIEALPERIQKNPAEGIRHYLTVGRIALAVASAIGTVLFREKRASAPSVKRTRPYAPVQQVTTFPGGMHGHVME